MINVFFISDTHFGHKNILEYEKEARPFASLEEMHEVMIERWNNVVKPKDVVYHLGDFCFGRKSLDVAERLNGKKKLVMGNHDTLPTAMYLQYFDKLYGMIFYNRCVLSHMPVSPKQLGARWWLNIHGHLHSKRVQHCVDGLYSLKVNKGGEEKEMLVRSPFDSEFEDDPNYFNVSCEQNNLTPIHWDVIRERLKEIDQ